MNRHKIGVFWGPYTPLTAPKSISTLLGVVAYPYLTPAWSARPHVGHLGAISASGGHGWLWLCWWCWALEANVRSIKCRNSKNCLQKYFFHSYVDPIHSWQLTHQLNKEELDLRTCNISWFLCPGFFGSIGTLVGLLLLLCWCKLATIEQLMWPKRVTRLGLLPAHCSRGRARESLLESTAPQCQLCRESCFGVPVGHFPLSMIGVQQWC